MVSYSMTHRDYRQYKESVEDFFKREGVDHLSPGHPKCPECGAEWEDGECPSGHGSYDLWNEPFFSWSPCDCCGSHLGGDRENACGWKSGEEDYREYTVCSDCVYYNEYGCLDDRTMLDVEKSAEYGVGDDVTVYGGGKPYYHYGTVASLGDTVRVKLDSGEEQDFPPDDVVAGHVDEC